MIRDEFLWAQMYRPKSVSECILPESLKSTFQSFVDQKEIPNLILSGRSGVGKTTVARAMLEELGCDHILINGSMNGNIDTLRNDIQQFASTVSFSGGRKYVILDEADGLNASSTQPALRSFMEEFSRNCGFILTCNFKNRIIPAIHSRCSVIDFEIPKSERAKMASHFFKRVGAILQTNHVQYDAKVVAELINMHFPDWRRVLNELQRYGARGQIDSGILSGVTDESYASLITSMKAKKFTEVRTWVAEHGDTDPQQIFRMFYDQSANSFKKESIPELVLIIARYMYNQGFVADQEINTVACLTEIMVSCEFI